MELKKIFVVILIISFGIGIIPGAGYSSLPNGLMQHHSVRLLHSDQELVTLELLTSNYELTTLETDGGKFQSLTVPGYGVTDQPGSPQLPITSVLVGIPEQGTVNVKIVDQDIAHIHTAYPLIPVPTQMPWDGISVLTELVYPQTLSEYSQADQPTYSPVTIEEYGWMRDLRFVRIGLYPFQYVPDQGTILWLQRMTVEVRIDNGGELDQPHDEIMSLHENADYFDLVMQENILNYEIAKSWRVTPPVTSTHLTTLDGERVRIVVDQDGLYRIGYNDLVSQGMADVDPRTLRMTNQGLDVAITVVGEDDGEFNEGDYILFYGEAFRGDTMAALYSEENINWNTYTQQLPDGTTTLWKPEFNATMFEKYTNQNIYWIQASSGEHPLRMEIVDGSPGAAELVPPTYRTTVHAEKQLNHWEYHYTSEDTWFWEFVADNNLRTYSTLLTAISPEPHTAVVRGEYVAFYYNNNISPDHIVSFYLNDGTTPINVSAWDGRSRHRFEVEVPSSALLEGENQLEFIITYDAISPWLAFDWFEIDYDRQYKAYNDEINYSREVVGTWRYKLTGFSVGEVCVLDITNPRQPVLVTNISTTSTEDGFQAEYQYSNEASTQFYAVSLSEIQPPESINLYNPPDLRSENNGADYLIISPVEFLEAAQALADYRSGQGHRVRIVNLRDLYNEFSEGIQHPIAIKNFLEYTFAHWTPPAPSYVLLIGDGHWNMLGGYPGTDPIYMPPNLGWVDSTQGEVDTTNLLATVVGDDPLPDVMIGRIPINSNQEFINVINKITAFEQTLMADWQRNITFIADNTPDNAGDFVAMSNLIIGDYVKDGFNPIRVFLDDYMDFGLCGTSPYPGGPACPAFNEEIIETLNGPGTLFATYVGHAAVQNWAHERVFLYHLDDPSNPNDMYYNDIDSLVNDDMLPVILSMDCLDGYWFHPFLQPSLAELFIRTGGYGAVATFSPTGLGVGSGHYALMQGFYGAIFNNGLWELGAAALGAKIQLYNAGYFREMIHTYTVFGDPALRMPSPYDLSINPIEASKQVYGETEVEYNIQVTNTGILDDIYRIQVDSQIFSTTLLFDNINLAPSETDEVVVTVTIPSNTQGPITDTATIQITSGGDVSARASIHLHTTLLSRISLPFIRK